MNALHDTLSTVNHFVVSDTASGVLLAGELLRRAPRECCLEFITAKTLGYLHVELWPPARNVVLVDLVPDREDPEETVLFLRKLAIAGHRLAGVLCGREAELWHTCLRDAGFDPETLAIYPEEGPNISTAKLLLRRPLSVRDDRTKELCAAATAAEGHGPRDELSELVVGILAASDDPLRRIHLARRLAAARHFVPLDRCIAEWHVEAQARVAADRVPGEAARFVREHRASFREIDRALAGRTDLGEGIFRVTSDAPELNVFCLQETLIAYRASALILDRGAASEDGRLIFKVLDPTADLVTEVQRAGIPVEGFFASAKILRQDEPTALTVMRRLMRERRRELTFTAGFMANIDLRLDG